MSTIQKLMSWYEAQCDGDWEHTYGVRIDTLDNPGWTVEVDVAETPVEGHFFEELDVTRTDVDWLYCRLQGGKLKGACGANNLEELLGRMVEWLTSRT